ncbi:MAG: cobalt transporter CbiM [Atopobiaceae bacterium]|jgi:cobalt/nickel transport system permease protein
MHIPENYLSPATCAVFTVAVVAVIKHAITRAKQVLPPEKLALLGIAAAFSFVAMMFNIPLPGGTTGHATCGVLIAILFGPWPATLAVSMTLAIQAFLFRDGGILSLAANCFNMAFILPHVGYAIYKRACAGSDNLGRELAAAAIGSYVGINTAALACALELGIQPMLFHDAAGQALYCPYPISVSVPAMMAGHLSVWGVAEATFTVGILAFVRKVAPDFSALGSASSTEEDNKRIATWPFSLLGALIALCPLGLIAEGDAWGEWSVDTLQELIGFAPSGITNGWEWTAFVPDYAFGNLPDIVGYILSAVIGTALLVLFFRLVAKAQKPKVSFEQ